MATAQDCRSRVCGAVTAGSFGRLIGALVVTIGLAAAPAAAQQAGGTVITAEQAMQLAASGEIVLVDVRSPQEWRQTGVPAGAQLVSIHQPNGLIGFLDAMGRTLGDDRSRPIAFICARGNRSSVASTALARAGYTQVYNVREGMFGSPDGPGWLARGLPTDRCRIC